VPGRQTDGLFVVHAAHVARFAIVVLGAKDEAVGRLGADLLRCRQSGAYARLPHRDVALRVVATEARALRRLHASMPGRAEIAAKLACAELAILIDVAILRARGPAQSGVGVDRQAAFGTHRRASVTAARTACPEGQPEHEHETADGVFHDPPSLHVAPSAPLRSVQQENTNPTIVSSFTGRGQ
jgi:hypothetical protein